MRLYYIDTLREGNPAFDECPEFCGNEETKRSDYCETCPTKRKQDEFLIQCEETLDKELKDSWRKYKLYDLLETVREVGNLGETVEPYMTLTTVALLEAYQTEEGLKKRIEDYNKKQTVT